MPFIPDAQITTVLQSPPGNSTSIEAAPALTLTINSLKSISIVVEPSFVRETILSVGQGPAGPSGEGSAPPILGKSLEYSGGRLIAVNLYADSAKTILTERRELYYSVIGVLDYVEYFNSVGSLVSTRTLQYADGILVGTVTT